MNTYTVYFELFGKRMKTQVTATSEENARQIIRNKIIFHDVQKEDDIMDFLLGFGKGKPRRQ